MELYVGLDLHSLGDGAKAFVERPRFNNGGYSQRRLKNMGLKHIGSSFCEGQYNIKSIDGYVSIEDRQRYEKIYNHRLL